MPFCQPVRVNSFSSRSARVSWCVDAVPDSFTSTPELMGRIQLGCVERSSLHSTGIAGEPAEAPRAIKEAHCRQPASGLTEYECGHERPADFGVLFHQSLEG